MRVRLGTLRRAIRRALREGGVVGPGVTADPTTGTSGGARDYDVERGADIHGYWYASPGDKATGGDYRPSDPAGYIGLTPPAEESPPGEAPVEESPVE